MLYRKGLSTKSVENSVSHQLGHEEKQFKVTAEVPDTSGRGTVQKFKTDCAKGQYKQAAETEGQRNGRWLQLRWSSCEGCALMAARRCSEDRAALLPELGCVPLPINLWSRLKAFGRQSQVRSVLRAVGDKVQVFPLCFLLRILHTSIFDGVGQSGAPFIAANDRGKCPGICPVQVGSSHRASPQNTAVPLPNGAAAMGDKKENHGSQKGALAVVALSANHG